MLKLNFTPFPTIHTDRLLLRRVEENDTAALFRLRSDPKVMQYLDRDPAASEEEVLNFIRKVLEFEAAGDAINWALCMQGTNDLIGNICIWNIQKDHHRGELGYTLLPEYHSQGLMTEALKVVIDFGFKTIGLHSLEANVNPHNLASIKILERQGFVKEAHYKENYFYNNQYLDTAIYSLLNK